MDDEGTPQDAGVKKSGSPHSNSGGEGPSGSSPKPKRRKVNHGKCRRLNSLNEY